ncbi:UDP-N-acetylglucosamine transferase subunit ALG13 homolog [Daktulosphaira vitifoliae]|uniref:UDP-N-acetylglucosamine transferase subunit ALG13 homolog n=1 Tax=Daktulosphaira vitifoliae TaxID=58002 RepID=UPI0021AA8CDE|nr:UDP-N-acetylglucosamine transferase subunit ALG13 homolog [Daktulosphaira vitifoliae]
MTNKSIFVTVGTTKFDELITAIINPLTLQILKKKGFSTITMQIGNSKIIPHSSGLIDIQYYTYKPDIEHDMSNHDLIISHGGAGSIMQALDHNKALLVVINENLMDNHQYELAEKLFEDKRLFFTTCNNLCSFIENIDFSSINSSSIDNSSKISKYIEHFLNV